MTNKLMTPLIAEFLLTREDLWGQVNFSADSSPVYELPVALAFADWMAETGRITREQAEREKRILTAISQGS